MDKFTIRRLLLVIPTIFLVTSIIFTLIQLIPGDVISNMLVDFEYRYTERDMEELKASLGIDVPVHVQYARWIGGVVQGDLGRSLYTNSSVTQELVSRLPVSFELGVIAIISSLIIALPIGIYSAIRQDTVGDYVARSFAILAISLPSFWLATLLIVYPSVWFSWTPNFEYIPFRDDPLNNFFQFLIPGVLMGMYSSGTTMRMTRAMMLEVLREDYVRTAWAKGLRERVVITRHALKNAFIPVVTLMGLILPVVVAGSVIMEEIFGLPGVGRYMLAAIDRRDYIVLAGTTLTLATAVIFANLIVDLSYGWLDPRVRHQ